MFAVAAVTVLPASALDGSTPFGFAWGPLNKIPKPSMALRDANVTVLIYRRDRLQSNEMKDTEMILLDVCNKEGLQQISWASRALSTNEATAKFAQAVGLRAPQQNPSRAVAGFEEIYWLSEST
jgi:hypothetical protein